jgi:hypothetical protein
MVDMTIFAFGDQGALFGENHPPGSPAKAFFSWWNHFGLQGFTVPHLTVGTFFLIGI